MAVTRRARWGCAQETRDDRGPRDILGGRLDGGPLVQARGDPERCSARQALSNPPLTMASRSALRRGLAVIGDAYARSSRAANAGGGNNAFAGGQHIHRCVYGEDCSKRRPRKPRVRPATDPCSPPKLPRRLLFTASRDTANPNGTRGFAANADRACPSPENLKSFRARKRFQKSRISDPAPPPPSPPQFPPTRSCPFRPFHRR